VEKLMYLVWLPEGTTRDQVGPLLLGPVADELLALDPRGLSMDLDDELADVAAPVPTPPGEHAVQAVVSIWLDAYDHRGPFEAVLNDAAERLAGYHVLESLYSDYGTTKWARPRDWPDGERSPGILTVAMFEQLAGMDLDAWLDYWHTKQSPMSAAVQPRCRYVRNTVFRSLTPGAPPYRGLVEDAWPSAADVEDPMRFYLGGGDTATMNANIATMIEHVTSFMDLATMRSLTMSEWLLRT
jgi:hypothetical protein